VCLFGYLKRNERFLNTINVYLNYNN